jgi:glutathione S-transferase
MKILEPFLDKQKKFLFGDKLTIADFWIAGLYVNCAKNPKVTFGKKEWN